MHRSIIATTLLCVLATAAHAQGRRAVADMPAGYACMRLNLPAGTLYANRNEGVPVLAAPNASAEVIGQAAEILVVPWPQQSRNGFLRVTLSRNSAGWVDARYLRPWSNPYAPKARCVPSIMSDGSVGTRTVTP